ncbi:MAG: SO_0444 family Cu/Zn efflux transporter, partial [Phycisphaerales bacterium]|nr:SO_0444 family Cu/Zn efflux transporter [Phycisphaerales bacterium]
LGGRGIIPIAKASLLGIPLPLCSCAVIPVAAGLRKQGASKGASAAFAISTPRTGEESIPLTWGLFGPFFALARPVIAVFTGLVAGILIDLTDSNKTDTRVQSADDDSIEDSVEDPGAIGLTITNADDAASAVAKVEKKATGSCCSSKQEPKASSCCSSKPEPAPGSCCSSNPEPASSCCSSTEPKEESSAGSCCSSTPQKTGLGFIGGTREAFRHGFGIMLVDLAAWLSVGLVMAAVIGAAVPPGWFEEHIGSGIMTKLIMLLVGIPLYICATSSTPLAFSLVVAGLSPGAALVLLLSGPATNVATMSWLLKDLGMKALVIYLATIAGVALGAGIIFDQFFLGYMPDLTKMVALHEHLVPLLSVKGIAALIFILLMAWALGMKMRKWMNTKGWGTTSSSGSGGCCSSNTGSSCGCS